MEVLQILKFIYRHDQLSFFGDLVCTEEDLDYIEVPSEVIHDLLARGRIEELTNLINAAA
ncbi:hypothetical protein CPB85DRAFT_153871 [Mucidula mucida]|nr:hypothetical protein CPB85DRAFT_153871 [Mucidula mucida]